MGPYSKPLCHLPGSLPKPPKWRPRVLPPFGRTLKAVQTLSFLCEAEALRICCINDGPRMRDRQVEREGWVRIQRAGEKGSRLLGALHTIWVSDSKAIFLPLIRGCGFLKQNKHLCVCWTPVCVSNSFCFKKGKELDFSLSPGLFASYPKPGLTILCATFPWCTTAQETSVTLASTWQNVEVAGREEAACTHPVCGRREGRMLRSKASSHFNFLFLFYTRPWIKKRGECRKSIQPD